jgi:hypothetical protein
MDEITLTANIINLYWWFYIVFRLLIGTELYNNIFIKKQNPILAGLIFTKQC